MATVPKKGVVTVCAAIQAIPFLLVGAFWFIPIGLAAIVAAGLIGAVVGQRMLKKHFIKAGFVSVR